jgi:hypothetical protein
MSSYGRQMPRLDRGPGNRPGRRAASAALQPSGNDFTHRFPLIFDALARLRHNADGFLGGVQGGCDYQFAGGCPIVQLILDDQSCEGTLLLSGIFKIPRLRRVRILCTGHAAQLAVAGQRRTAFA